MRKTTYIALIGSALAVVWLVMRAGRSTDTTATRQDGATGARIVSGGATGRNRGDDATPTNDPRPLPPVLVDPAIVIEKRDRLLSVLSDGVEVKRYRIVLGSAPVSAKEREGDGRTPEGRYFVCSRGATSHYTHALGISYPGPQDADRGLEQGLISKREHRTIMEAQHRMQRPPWNTALGGEIMIHEGGTGSDWTAGCIALADDDMAELFDATPLGATVDILP